MAYDDKPPEAEAEEPKETTTEPDFMTTARARYEAGYDREIENMDAAYEDLSFVAGGEQWDATTRKQREAENRPCLEVPKLSQFVRQVTGEIRQMRPAIKCVPVDDRGDPETADTIAGMFRYVENRSSAKIVYGKACDSQVTAGIGAWRVMTEYADETTFNLDLRISSIDDPVAVIFDPDAVEPSRCDAMFCFVPVDMSSYAFELKYPGKMPGDFDGGTHSAWGSWTNEDYVRVAEYWYKEPVKRKLMLKADGSVDDITDLEPEEMALAEEYAAMAQAQGVPVRIEERDSHKVMRAVISSSDILEEPKEWPGRYIPIVPLVGEEIRIGRKLVRRGIVRPAKDLQRMYNYFVSADTEIVALQPKSPFIGTEKNFEQYQDIWETANTANHPYLPYTPDPANGSAAPQRVQPPVSSQGINEGARRATEDMMAVIGIYNASLGAQSNETSGKAIMARQREGDTGTYHYISNFGEAIQHTGKIILDLIPYVYDTERTIRIVGEDGEEKTTTVNKAQGIQDQEGAAQRLQNDVTIGAYDVVIEMGPAFNTRREEAREGMTAFLQSAPDMAPMVLDIIADMQDWPKADEIRERLEAMAPPPIKALLAAKRGEPPQPDPGAQQAQQESQLEQGKIQLEMKKLELESEKLAVERDKLQVDAMKVRADLEMAQMSTAVAMNPPAPPPAAPDPRVDQLAEAVQQLQAGMQQIVSVVQQLASGPPQPSPDPMAGAMPPEQQPPQPGGFFVDPNSAGPLPA
jgi:X-X-X-Leu-X-X-Gly heptad repeat protein